MREHNCPDCKHDVRIRIPCYEVMTSLSIPMPLPSNHNNPIFVSALEFSDSFERHAVEFARWSRLYIPQSFVKTFIKEYNKYED